MVTGRLPLVGFGSPPTGLVSSDNTRAGTFQAGSPKRLLSGRCTIRHSAVCFQEVQQHVLQRLSWFVLSRTKTDNLTSCSSSNRLLELSGKRCSPLRAQSPEVGNSDVIPELCDLLP